MKNTGPGVDTRVNAQKLPRITLVTPSFNQGVYLEETIKSVLSQKYGNLEYIIMDGGSSDCSVEIIRRYADHITYWQSAPDGGQSDSIREGFGRGSGDILNWLNSDDLLAPGALEHMAAMYRAAPNAGIYAATVENFYDGCFDIRERSVPGNIDIPSLLAVSGRLAIRHQPGIFFSRSLYEKTGGIDARHHIYMDFALHAKLLLAGGEVQYSDATVAYFRRHQKQKTESRGFDAGRHVREWMGIADEIGRAVNIRPNYRAAHLITLCSGSIGSIRSGRPREAYDAFRLAISIGGIFGVVWCLLDRMATRVGRRIRKLVR